MNVGDVVCQVEADGAALRLEGDRIRIWFPEPQAREELASKIGFLRAHRKEVTEFLRVRRAIPAMPAGLRLVSWSLKEPPIAIELCAVVTDPALFARSTVEQLRTALAHPKRWVGWTVPQLIDRLAQVGVVLVLEGEGPGNEEANK
jgi:hypothetical protein